MSLKNTFQEFIPPQDIKLAFFDLDETITCKDTDLLWALWRSRRSFKGLIDLLGLQKISRLYYSHNLTAADYSDYHLKRARSMTVAVYEDLAFAFAASTVKRFVYPSMIKILSENKTRGIQNVLITAQDEIIAKAFCNELSLDACLASSYQTKDGKFTAMNKPLCFQEGKVYWAQSYLNKKGLSWKDCAFYSDSLNDLPLLESCQFPVIVHPGAELAVLAGQRRWPVFRPERP